MESKETIEPVILEQVAKVLKVPAEAIKNFDEETAVYNIQHNYEGSNQGVANVAVQNYQCTFNPIEKIVQLYEEKIELYERMLKEKSEMLDKLTGKEQNKQT